MLGDISSVNKIYLVTGATDMRRSIDGLMAIIRDVYDLDPYSNAVFLFCGKRADRIKALHYEKDGFCLLYKRLEKSQDDIFHFQWYNQTKFERMYFPMTRADFSGHSKDETIEYLINEHNAMEHQLADLRQELAESKEIIAEFKRMIFASR